MTSQLETTSRRWRIQPGWIAAGLLVLTVAGGVAARVATNGTVAAPADGLHFSSPSNGGVQFSGRLDRRTARVGLTLAADFAADRARSDRAVAVDRPFRRVRTAIRQRQAHP